MSSEGMLATLISALEEQGELATVKPTRSSQYLNASNDKLTSSKMGALMKPTIMLPSESNAVQPTSRTPPKKRPYHELESLNEITTAAEIDYGSTKFFIDAPSEASLANISSFSSMTSLPHGMTLPYGGGIHENMISLPGVLGIPKRRPPVPQIFVDNNKSKRSVHTSFGREAMYKDSVMMMEQRTRQQHQQQSHTTTTTSKHRSPPINFDDKKARLAELLFQFKTRFYDRRQKS